jgi:hypothetical protein
MQLPFKFLIKNNSNICFSCTMHPEQISMVSCSSDFEEKCPNGGCAKKCGYTLPCFHICILTCHPYDQNHDNYVCRNPCNRTCENLHPCKKLCHESCGDCNEEIEKQRTYCGHVIKLKCKDFDTNVNAIECSVLVTINFPRCSHSAEVPCSTDRTKARCSSQCDTDLPCGHKCIKKCHAFRPNHYDYQCRFPCKKLKQGCTSDHNCPKRCFEICDPCDAIIEKTRSCGHVYKMPCSDDCELIDCEVEIAKTRNCGHTYVIDCSADEEKIKCRKPCSKIFPCGHPCPLKCFEKCQPCQIQVDKMFKCGHTYTMTCSDDPIPCVTKVDKIRSCNHIHNIECYRNVEHIICRQKCIRKSQCQHGQECSRKCCETCEPCMTLVKKTRSCGHKHTVKCSENVEMISCFEKCTKVLKCGHPCFKKCSEMCEPCRIPVKKLRSCGHTHVTRCIDDPENVIICKEKCMKQLQCGHECQRKCHEICQHCQVKVSKTARCGHIVEVECWITSPKRDACKSMCELKLPCGHTCDRTCNQQCTDVCLVEIPHNRPCGHMAMFQCWEVQHGMYQ